MLLRVPWRYHNHGRSCSILALSLLDGRRSADRDDSARRDPNCERDEVSGEYSGFWEKYILYIKILEAVRISSRREGESQSSGRYEVRDEFRGACRRILCDPGDGT